MWKWDGGKSHQIEVTRKISKIHQSPRKLPQQHATYPINLEILSIVGQFQYSRKERLKAKEKLPDPSNRVAIN